jgi:putative aldouronate transport system permease protein
MIRERDFASRLFDIANYLFLAAFGFAMLYPMLNVFNISISDHQAIMLGEVKLFPVGFDLTAYRITLLNPDIWRAYFNTILYSAAFTVLSLLLNSMVAFPLSIPSLPGRKLVTIYITLTMFFSGGLIPTYLLISGIGLMDTMWAIVLPTSVGAWNIIIFRTNFQTLPDSLVDSASIDGARGWSIYFRIILPLSKPILATIGLFSIVGQWNNFFGPLLYLNTSAKLPLQNYLRSLIVTQTFEGGHMAFQLLDNTLRGEGSNTPGLLEAIKMAAIIVSLGPILLVYPFIQRYFVKGVLIGSLKG